MTYAIQTNALTKCYESTRVVDSLSLTVPDGTVYGLVGPNGAGKTTTIDILLDYRRQTSGSVQILGRRPQEVVPVHQRIGILPQGFSVYPSLTGRQHLRLVIETKQADDTPAELLTRVGLGDAGEQVAETYSRGMKQRLALAMALVGEPELLILDEPFNGLDPGGVMKVREILAEENQRGATIFFSSHVLTQVETICDQIGIMHDGALVAEGSFPELVDGAPIGPVIRIVPAERMHDVHSSLVRHESVHFVSIAENSLLAHLAEDSNLESFESHVRNMDVAIGEIKQESPGMESIYLAYTEDTSILEVEP